MQRTAVTCLFSLFVAGALSAQGVTAKTRQLQPIDLFRLDFLMTYPAEDPVGWLDAEHYLVFDAGPEAMPGRGKSVWSKVVAKTGARSEFVDRSAVATALRDLLAEPGALAAIDDAAVWTWNADHTRYVVNLGNDLFSGDCAGKIVRLTATPAIEEVGVRFSPRGDRVAFVANHNLHVVAALGREAGGETDGEVRALTTEGHADLFYGRLDWVYQEELYGRGNFQGYWWSPDSEHIALLRLDESPVQEFVLVRETPARPEIERTNYPKAGEPNPIVDIGVIAVESGETKWFDVANYPADDRLIVRVTWAPDSAEVFFQVQGREQTWLDMVAGSVASGEVRKLWREESDCWVEAGPEPKFLQGGAEFLWLSERDGFKHLYRYARSGKLLAQLTSGEWQVKKVSALDEDAGVVYLLSDRGERLDTHLWAQPIEGGAMRRITEGSGTYEIDMAPDHATLIARYSEVMTPPCTFLLDVAGKQLRAVAQSRPQMMEDFAISRPQFHKVPTRDGFEMAASLTLPAGFEQGKRYPVVQFTYSGPHTPRVRNEWGGRDFLWHQMLAQRGYAVFVCDNRSASGFGRKFAKACWREPGQSELRDLEDSVAWLGSYGGLDPERIAIWGWSYGGYQTLYNLTHSTKWKCGVAVNAVTDWRNYDTIYTERYFGLPSTNKKGYDAGDVNNAARNLHGDLLLMAATLDDNVHVQNTYQFLHALQKANKDCELMLYPGVRHGIGDLQQQLHLFGKFLRFLEAKL